MLFLLLLLSYLNYLWELSQASWVAFMKRLMLFLLLLLSYLNYKKLHKSILLTVLIRVQQCYSAIVKSAVLLVHVQIVCIEPILELSQASWVAFMKCLMLYLLLLLSYLNYKKLYKSILLTVSIRVQQCSAVVKSAVLLVRIKIVCFDAV